jgi:hypothetical protein
MRITRITERQVEKRTTLSKAGTETGRFPRAEWLRTPSPETATPPRPAATAPRPREVPEAGEGAAAGAAVAAGEVRAHRRRQAPTDKKHGWKAVRAKRAARRWRKRPSADRANRSPSFHEAFASRS